MIIVTARLPGRSVFLAGEHIECKVTFTNVVKHRRDGTPTKCKSYTLAWASAQIHCQCSVSESRVDLPKTRQLTSSEVTTSGNDTSFIPCKGEKGSTVLATKPSILFCDLVLAPGESQTFTYSELIPSDAPPTFRGNAVKYSYKITVGTQKFNCPTKLLRIPFRVLVVPGLNDVTVYGECDELKPNNPFKKTQQKESSVLEVALEVLQTITCRKAAYTYNITNARGKVAKFCLFKQAYKIGDDIVGTCDFSEATIPCVQFSVTLQSEEVVTEECRKKSKDTPMIIPYSNHDEVCLHTCRSHISIPIPLTVTPGFSTDLVSLRWHLHFEFIISKNHLEPMKQPESPSESATWQGPSYLDVETMVWDLPVKIYATNPMYATSVSLLKTEVSHAL